MDCHPRLTSLAFVGSCSKFSRSVGNPFYARSTSIKGCFGYGEHMLVACVHWSLHVRDMLGDAVLVTSQMPAQSARATH